MRVRFWLALWTGKIVGLIIKVLGKKGTTFPGVIARKIYPDIIKLLALSFKEGTIIITGTNGKTTTNNLLASVLKTAGLEVAFNREGANMLTGITGALLQFTSFSGKSKADILLLEVDEATVPGLCQQLTPRLAVVTNFFRDQLDRYGELDTTINLVKEALPDDTQLILNADDPLVAQIGIGKEEVYYYGVQSLPSSKKESSETREGRYCAKCGQELTYTLFHYGQLGVYKCPFCGFQRPDPYIEAKDINQGEQGISFWVDREYHIPLIGSYNLYNALAAFCAADRIGIAREDIGRGLQIFISDAGRMEQFTLPGYKLTLTLVKNPTGFDQVIKTLAEIDKPLHLLIAINDLAADGRDISWLWDVDFETLAEKRADIHQLLCSGLRAEDMALRLKYAGFTEDKIIIEKSLAQAVDKLGEYQKMDKDAVFILPTYTALFPLRDILVTKRIPDSRVKGESA
ncbi:MAG: UDP-N-acetylmuramyl peptide synthase [Gracilibacter sp. BRH_c7a]|nr:MAG: UDP-N-acetylmuramyl peptide synthase [Gracilibacter sp. BRH_c7a]